MNSEPLGKSFKAFCSWQSTSPPPPPPPAPVPVLDKQGEQVIKNKEPQWEEIEPPPPPPPKMSYRAFCKLLRQSHFFTNDLSQLEAAELYAATADMSKSPQFEELDYAGFKKLVWHIAHKAASHLAPPGAFSRAFKSKLTPYAKQPAACTEGPATGDWVYDLPIHLAMARATPLLKAIFKKYQEVPEKAAAVAGVGPNSAWAAERGLDLDALEEDEAEQWAHMRVDHKGLLRMAIDYELCPQLLSELDVRSISSSAVGLRRLAGRADDDETDSMAVADWVDALAMLAAECFGRPPLCRIFSSRQAQVGELLDRLLSQHRKVFAGRPSREISLADTATAPSGWLSGAMQSQLGPGDEAALRSLLRAYGGGDALYQAGLYRLARSAGLLCDALDLGRIQMVFSAASRVTPAVFAVTSPGAQYDNTVSLDYDGFLSALFYFAALSAPTASGGRRDCQSADALSAFLVLNQLPG